MVSLPLRARVRLLDRETYALRARERLLEEWEVYVVLVVCSAWYLTNLDGAFFIDEVFYARTGNGLLYGWPYRNPTHLFAPTAQYFIGLGQWAFGRTSFAIRFPVMLFGLLTLYVTYRFGKLLRSRAAGFFTASLLAVTHAYTRSVAAFLDVPMALFLIALA